jgi:flagellar FliL protein
MAEENEITGEGISRRNIILFSIAGLLAVLLIVGIILSVLFFTGVLSANDDLETRLAELENGGQSSSESDRDDEDSSGPRLLELPDSNRLDTLYYTFAQPFVVNVLNSRKVMQLNLTISTHYDQQVIDNITKHELAVRSAALEYLSFITEEQIAGTGFRQKVGEELAVVLNAELENVEGFGGIERVLFTEFLMQ